MCTCRPLRPLPLPPWSRSGLWGWAEWAWGWHHSWRPGRRCKPPTKGAIKGQGRVARHYILQLTSSRGALYSNLRYCLHLLRGLFEYSVNIISRRWRGALQWLFVTVRATAGDSSKKKKKRLQSKAPAVPHLRSRLTAQLDPAVWRTQPVSCDHLNSSAKIRKKKQHLEGIFLFINHWQTVQVIDGSHRWSRELLQKLKRLR